MNKMLFISWIAISLSGCSLLVQVKPEIEQVRKIGFLSVYINNQFHNRNQFKEDVGLEMLDFFGDNTIDNTKVAQDLTEYYVKQFEVEFTKVGLNDRLEWIPPIEYVNSLVYRAPIKEEVEEINIFNFDDSFNIEEQYFSTPNDVKLLPLNKIVTGFKTEGENVKIVSKSVSYEEIGNFSKKLGFDGLIVAEIDAGYQKLDFMEGSRIKPSVTFRLIIIDKQGRLVLSVGEPLKNERKVYTGKVVSSLLLGDYIDLSSNPDGLISGYKVAIDKYLEDLFDIIREKL